MKKIFAVILFLLFATISFALTEQEVLQETPNQLKDKVQEMLNVGINSEPALLMVKNMLQNRVQTQHAAKVIDAIIEAKRQGLPVGPIVSKVNEGFAKNVQIDQIENAINKIKERYQFAYQQLNRIKIKTQAKKQIAKNIVDAMAAGIKKNDIITILHMMNQKMNNIKEKENFSIEVTEMVKEMARYGVKSEKTKDTIANAIKHQFSLKEMKELRKAFKEQARYNNPNHLAEKMNENISNGLRGEHAGKGLGNSSGMSGNSSSGGSGSHGGGAGNSGGSGGHGGGRR